MKKTLSILLSLVMIISVISIGAVSVFGYTPIAINTPTDIDITYSGEVVYFSFTPPESGNYSFYSYNNDSDPRGAIYDGSTCIAENDDGGEGSNFLMFAYLDASKTYDIRCYMWGSGLGGYTVVIEKNPLESITYTPCSLVTARAGTYEYPNMAGDKVTFHFSDGEPVNYYVSANHPFILFDEEGNQYENQYGFIKITLPEYAEGGWSPEATDLYFTYAVGGCEATVPFKIVGFVRTPTSISLSLSKPIELIENLSGEDYGDHFEYYYSIPDGSELTVNYSDETSKVFTYCNNKGFVDANGESLDSYDYYPNAAWTLGSDNELCFETYGLKTTVPVSVIKNPIKSFSFVSAPIYENVYGDLETDDNGDDFFYYYDAGMRLGSQLTLNYNNGTSTVYTAVYDDYYGTTFVDDKGDTLPYELYYNYDLNQYSSPLTVGDNTITVYLNSWAQSATVTVFENDVDSIALELASYAVVGDGNPYQLLNQNGNKLTVNFKDSTTKVYTLKWDSKKLDFVFYDENGVAIDKQNLDYYPSSEEGHVYICAEYRGAYTQAEITFSSAKVTEIRYVPLAPIVLNPDNCGDKLKNGNYYFNQDDYFDCLFESGSVLLVYFDDGTVKKYTAVLGNDQQYWFNDEAGQAIDYNNFYYYPTKEQTVFPWTPDSDNSITIGYREVLTTVPVIIDDNYDGYKGFPDVGANDWYNNAVKFCATRGLITGYKSGKFGPADTLKRQDFVVILARIAGADLDKYEILNSKMPDVEKGSYYAAAVNWAVDKGIINGYDNGKFGVGDSITREQVATILYRYLKSPAVTGADAALSPFADRNSISGFAKNAMVWAVQNGVISGKNATTLAPTATASRAEIATIVMRMEQRGMFD